MLHDRKHSFVAFNPPGDRRAVSCMSDDDISCGANPIVYWRQRAPWNWKPHKRQTVDILRHLAGVAYVASSV
jgi:hypothetical protein